MQTKICSKCKLELDISKFSCTKRSEDGTCKYRNSQCNTCRSEGRRLKQGSIKKIVPKFTEDSKECLICNIVKPFSEFYTSKRGRFGLSAYCSKCQIRATPEKSRKYTADYRKRHNARYKAQHRLNMLKRRSNIVNASDSSVTDAFLSFVYEQDKCCWCGRITPEDDRTLEHILELSSGGLHSVHNINMACFSCNSSRLNRSGENPCESLFSKFIEKETNDNLS